MPEALDIKTGEMCYSKWNVYNEKLGIYHIIYFQQVEKI